ncbi:glycosyltransferase [Escherichia coli]|uniref:glycosyltransferase n=3 Tax=Escherichia coli TaxID=562 RepID=UPI000CF2C4FA|nr:glycosyltransferase [Escherichia coli]EEV9321797.1 glycosyltransferase [Escherichia coli]EEW5975206.1 glycosyltransferase [Escherichia coli]ELF7484265.1 glycosyltransferase [Escherichia coli]ELO1896548.1 glycosyltransferase [Escherichia coli]ELO3206071.1 glycosyltransferase [Escherichia coli]
MINKKMEGESLVIIATYNGEKYIRDAIDSIPNICDIFISDDLSKDSTLATVRDACNRKKAVEIITFSSGGAAALNFANAINNVPNTYEYYFLADQDDVWTENKYEILISEIKDLEKHYGKDCPLLIFGDSIVVDESLNIIGDSFFKYDGINPNILMSDIRRLYFQNVAQGATFIFNNSLLKMITPLPNNIYMHDWWLLLCAMNFGKVKLSKHKTLLYRQHGRNSIGAKKRNILSQILNHFSGNGKIAKHYLNIYKQNNTFFYKYEDIINVEAKNFLFEYCHVKNRNFFYRKYFLIKNKIYLSNFKRTVALYLYF